MYKITPSPLGGLMLANESGLVIAAGANPFALRFNMQIMIERRELSPFLNIKDEFGTKTTIKEYLKR